MKIDRSGRLAIGYTGGLSMAMLASWLRVALTGTLRVETGQWTFAVCSLLLGSGLALSSYCAWKLAKLNLPAAVILRWALPAHLVLALAAPITSADFYQYVAYGLLDVQGKNPLAYGPEALHGSPIVDLAPSRWLAQPSVYGPTLLFLFKACALLGRATFAGTAVVLKLALAGCTALASLLAARMVRADGRAFALFAFSPLLAWELSGQGHSDAVLLVLLLVFAWAAVEDRQWLATLAIVLATLGKLTMAPILALYLLFILKRTPLRAVALGAAGLALSAVLCVPYARGFPGFGPFLGAVRGTRSHSLGDLLAIALTPLGPGAQDLAVRASFILCLAACGVVFAVVTVRARDVHHLLRGCLLFLLAWDMTVPLFQPWYISWLFPLALADPDRRWLRLVSLYGIFSVVQWIVQLDPLTSVAIDVWVVWRTARLLQAGTALAAND